MMTSRTLRQTAASPSGSLMAMFRIAFDYLERIPNDVIALFARFGIAGVFWRSGQTKVSGWEITDSTIFLFEKEYKVPLIQPELAAHMAAIAEHVFPVLLVIGLASRFSAASLLVMTTVIQVFVYPNQWPEHAVWACALAFILARGPGAVSADHLIRKKIVTD